MEITTQEVPNSQSNNTDINNTDFNETDFNEIDSIQSYLSPSAGEVRPVGEDVIERMETYRALIQENIDYECFLDRREKEDVDELIELMVEILMMPDDSVVRIGGADKPVSVVKSRFLKLTYSHIEYVLFSLHRNTSKGTPGKDKISKSKNTAENRKENPGAEERRAGIMRVRFEEDEMFVMAMFKKENRLATMQEIRRILPFIKEDGEMLALVNHTLEKMDQLTDKEFAAIDLEDYLQDTGEEP